MNRTPPRLAILVAVVLGFLVLNAPQAGANGVRPSNFESVIDSVDPPTPTVKVEILGGDSFFQVTAAPGTKVQIPGYDDEPYLRIDADGTVERNQRSPATYLNVSRNSTTSLPPGASSTARPKWQRIGTGGRVAWHDHRIHWMASIAPVADGDGVVQEWILPMQVDGNDVTVQGRLVLRDDVLPWAALVSVFVAAGALLLGRRDRQRVPILAGAALIALGLSVGTQALNPPGAQASPLPLILPCVALALLVISLVLPRRFPGASARLSELVLPLAAAAALVGWAVPQIGVFWMPSVPSALAIWFVRAATGVVFGATIGVVAAILLRPLPASPSTRPEPQPAR